MASAISTISFLQSAAYDLTKSSPAISAHLYGRFLETADALDVTLPSQQLSRLACAACNTVWISGFNLQVSLRESTAYGKKRHAKRKDKRQRRAALTNNQDATPYSEDDQFVKKSVCYRCLVCEQVTRFPIAPDAEVLSTSTGSSDTPVSTPRKSDTKTEPVTPSPSTPDSAKLSASASSRKRQKMRKQNSLQQMLAKAKAEKQGVKMNLMDLMKSSGT